MTYNVFSGTLNPTQSINVLTTQCKNKSYWLTADNHSVTNRGQRHRFVKYVISLIEYICQKNYIPAINSSKTFANLRHDIPVLRVYWQQLGLSPQRHLMCLKQSENCLPHHHLHRSYQNHCPCVFLNYTIKIHDYLKRRVNSTDIYYKYATY